METTCLICERANATIDLYGYTLCPTCKSKLGLFTDETIKGHVSKFNKSEKGQSYKEEIQSRLALLQKKYIKTEMKFLHILERLEQLGS